MDTLAERGLRIVFVETLEEADYASIAWVS